MYSENNRSSRRGNDEFFRRMTGGDIGGKENCPIPSCRHGGYEAAERDLPSRARLDMGERPPCNEGDGGVCHLCPNEIHAPALAMVYCPRQCWRHLLEPSVALSKGTLFAELVLPFEAGCNYEGKEGCTRRCNL